MNNLNSMTFASCHHCHAINKVSTQKVILKSAICGRCKAQLNFHGLVSEADEVGLMKVIANSNLPVVVDFWAPWCGPCRSFAPTFEAASKSAEGKMVFLKINTEQFPQISSRFNIRGIPTLMIFKNGLEVARESGAFPLEMFNQWISRFF